MHENSTCMEKNILNNSLNAMQYHKPIYAALFLYYSSRYCIELGQFFFLLIFDIFNETTLSQKRYAWEVSQIFSVCEYLMRNIVKLL